jgi:hypothetical protein
MVLAADVLQNLDSVKAEAQFTGFSALSVEVLGRVGRLSIGKASYPFQDHSRRSSYDTEPDAFLVS